MDSTAGLQVRLPPEPPPSKHKKTVPSLSPPFSAQVLLGSPLQSAPPLQVLRLLPGSGHQWAECGGEGRAQRRAARPRVSGQNGGHDDVGDGDDDDDDVIIVCWPAGDGLDPPPVGEAEGGGRGASGAPFGGKDLSVPLGSVGGSFFRV